MKKYPFLIETRKIFLYEIKLNFEKSNIYSSEELKTSSLTNSISLCLNRTLSELSFKTSCSYDSMRDNISFKSPDENTFNQEKDFIFKTIEYFFNHSMLIEVKNNVHVIALSNEFILQNKLNSKNLNIIKNKI